MASVFISYRHEDEEHNRRVLSLAVWLRNAGLSVVYDGFAIGEGNRDLAPPEGWAKWSVTRAGSQDHRVIIVASAGWFRSFCNQDQCDPTGRGSAAEAVTIFHRLYRDKGNHCAVVAYFDAGRDLANLHPFFEQCPRRDASNENHLNEIVRWVRGQTSSSGHAGLCAPIAWPRTVNIPRSALADRREPCELFAAMLTGVAGESVINFVAEGGTGKSKLLEVFRTTAAQEFADDHGIAYVGKLGEHNLDDFAFHVCSCLGGYTVFERYARAVLSALPSRSQHLALLDDLRHRVTPSLIILDKWDTGSDELRTWILDHFVPAVVLAPAVKLIIAGEPKRPYPPTRSGQIASFNLGHIPEHEWDLFIDVRYPAHAERLKPTIKLLLASAPSPARGVKTIAEILALLDESRALPT